MSACNSSGSRLSVFYVLRAIQRLNQPSRELFALSHIHYLNRGVIKTVRKKQYFKV